MIRNNSLPITEELDFHYLLELMRPLKSVPEYAWLPELFAIVGHESLIQLCKYAGGEIIKIPTLDELNNSLEALQWFYDVYIEKRKEESGIPYRLIDTVNKIKRIYDVRDGEIIHS